MSQRIKLSPETNWELLKRFNICARSKSFSNAANVIGTSPSALLNQIEQLEGDIGAALFIRGPKNRSMQLIEEGIYLKKATDKMFQIASDHLFIGEPLEEESYEVVRVITTSSFAESILLEVFSDFLKNHGMVQLQVVTQMSPRLIEEGEIFLVPHLVEQKNIIKHHLLTYYMKFYAGKDYINSYGKPSSSDALINHDFLAFNYLNSPIDKLLLRLDNSISVVPAVVSNSFNFLKEMGIRDHGLIEFPDIVTQDTGLEEILPDTYRQKNDLYMAYIKTSTYRPLFNEMVQSISQYFSSFPGKNPK